MEKIGLKEDIKGGHERVISRRLKRKNRRRMMNKKKWSPKLEEDMKKLGIEYLSKKML